MKTYYAVRAAARTITGMIIISIPAAAAFGLHLIIGAHMGYPWQ